MTEKKRDSVKEEWVVLVLINVDEQFEDSQIFRSEALSLYQCMCCILFFLSYTIMSIFAHASTFASSYVIMT